jgi:hypothetical protein
LLKGTASAVPQQLDLNGALAPEVCLPSFFNSKGLDALDKLNYREKEEARRKPGSYFLT